MVSCENMVLSLGLAQYSKAPCIYEKDHNSDNRQYETAHFLYEFWQ